MGKKFQPNIGNKDNHKIAKIQRREIFSGPIPLLKSFKNTKKFIQVVSKSSSIISMKIINRNEKL